MKKLKELTAQNQPELSLTDLTTRIVERESRIDACCALAVKQSMDAVKLAADQGRDLLLAKAQVKHGDWAEWVENNYVKATGKSYRLARSYMQLASNWQHAANITDADMKTIREAFRMLGMLPEVEAEQKQLPSIGVSPVISKLNFIAEWVVREGDVISTWEQIRRDELKLQLKPVVELFEKL